MRILISADLEGVSGVAHPDQIYPDGKFYKETLVKWAAELNAVVEGLNEAGVKDIVINDSHNHMRNLDNALVPKASVIIGWQKPFSMVSSVNNGVDACFFMGYHAMAGTSSTLSHTYRPRIIKKLFLNNIAVGETGLNAALAGSFNVPIVFISGDEATCSEAKSLLGEQLITVSTKCGLSRYAALSYPFDEVLKNLKEAAIKTVKEKNEWKVFKVNSPCTISVVFGEPNHADACELIPGIKRVSDNQVEFTDSNYSVVFKCFLAMGALAASRDDVVT